MSVSKFSFCSSRGAEYSAPLELQNIHLIIIYQNIFARWGFSLKVIRFALDSHQCVNGWTCSPLLPLFSKRQYAKADFFWI